jgi:hypothetical protein
VREWGILYAVCMTEWDRSEQRRQVWYGIEVGRERELFFSLRTGVATVEDRGGEGEGGHRWCKGGAGHEL